jgi:hypothetical protein
VWHNTKWEQITVGDEKDHVVGVGEYKGIISNIEGKSFGDGWLTLMANLVDISPKTGVTGNGYITLTDKDGNKIYLKWDQKPGGPYPMTFFKGTGKFEGVQGKGTFSAVYTADPSRFYVDWDVEVELPR